MKTAVVVTCLFTFIAVVTHATMLESLDGLEISMPGTNDKKDGHVQLFAIEATQEGKSWTVMHRYNDFVVLKSNLVDEATDESSWPTFPPKPQWFQAMWSPTQEMIDERRQGLEKWLQHALAESAKKNLPAWSTPLQEFLHDEAVAQETSTDWVKSVLIGARTKADGAWKHIGETWEKAQKLCEENPQCKGSKEMLQKVKTQAMDSVATFKKRLAEVEILNKAATKAQEVLSAATASGNQEDIAKAQKDADEANAKAVEKAKELEELKENIEELNAESKLDATKTEL